MSNGYMDNGNKLRYVTHAECTLIDWWHENSILWDKNLQNNGKKMLKNLPKCA